jgi:hypothetical protein
VLFAKVIALKKIHFRQKFGQKAERQIFFPWLSIINTQLTPINFFIIADKLESHAGGPFK